MNADAVHIIEFWFDSLDGDDSRAEWFRNDPAFDALIQQRFGALIESALAGELTHWMQASRPALARILLLDQFTRNVFRNTPRAFAGDPMALAAARDMVAKKLDRTLPAYQRWFVYLPFEHAEDMAAQHEGLKQFAVLAWQEPRCEAAFEWALKHYDVMVRFGRYPHRNAALRRTSTEAELEFLHQPGSTF